MLNNIYKNNRFQLSGVLILFFLLMAKVQATQLESIALEVQYDKTVPVNLKKYGVNGATLGSDLSYGDSRLVEAYKDIGLNFTRFPGGTIGNYYNWSSGGFSCKQKPDKRASSRIARMNKTLKKTKSTYSVDDFLNFVNATDTEFTYMLNILCESVESNSKLLQYMKVNNLNLKYIELGNEMYSNSYSWVYEDAESYIKGAERNYAAIKKSYPDAKIGLVVSPISFSSNSKPEPDGKPNESWPKKRRDYDVLSANSAFADALIIHVYDHPYNNKWLKSDPVTFEEHFLSAIGHFNNKFNVSMSYLQKLGENKSIWITEWGVSAPIKKRQGIFSEYKKSAFHALYVASVLSSITLEKNIELANYHIIRDLWQVSKQGYEITPVGKVLNMFINTSKRSNNVYEVAVNAGTSGIKALMFSADEGDELFVINENNKTFVINTIIAKNNLSSYKVESMSVINDEFKVESNVYKSGLDGAGVIVKPYSILRISKPSSDKK